MPAFIFCFCFAFFVFLYLCSCLICFFVIVLCLSSIGNSFPFFIFTHFPTPSCVVLPLSQTPQQISRCYEKPWLVNSKTSTPSRGFDYSDYQISSCEVEYGPPAHGESTPFPSIIRFSANTLFHHHVSSANNREWIETLYCVSSISMIFYYDLFSF